MYIKKIIGEYIDPYFNLLRAKLFQHSTNKVSDGFTILDTGLASDNLGDLIINYYCGKVFDELNMSIKNSIPTHRKPTKSELKSLKETNLKIVTGTNILNSTMNRMAVWKLPSNITALQNVCLMGVGWSGYTEKENYYTRNLLEYMLSKTYLHSVRDSYTENKLRKLGIENVVNTACPTMWNLTEEYCRDIPTTKSSNVVTTITDYDQDRENDWFMLDTLLELYSNVYVWIQGDNDEKYLDSYPRKDELLKVSNSLEAYNKLLEKEDLDYVGTRLHAGVHALNYKRRSLIISIDNRAREIARDTGLPIIERKQLQNSLRERILSNIDISIRLPEENIKYWKQQFIKNSILK
ncbi:polysaccharide pyruvyl transferase family protein [Lactobacillus sp. AN1001]